MLREISSGRNPGDKVAEEKFKKSMKLAWFFLIRRKKVRRVPVMPGRSEWPVWKQTGGLAISAGFEVSSTCSARSIWGLWRRQQRKTQQWPRRASAGLFTITFEEAAFGTKKEIRLNKYVKCKTCGSSAGTGNF